MATLIGEAASHVTTRTRRRTLVAGTYLGAGASLALGAASRKAEGFAMEAAASVLLLLAFAGYLMLLHLTHHSRTNPPALLDERELAMRDQGYRRAYRLLSWTVAAGLLYCWMAALSGWWMPEGPREWAGVLAGACFLVASFPPAVIAWREPDAPVEDPADREAEREALRGVPLSPLRWRLLLGLTGVVGTIAAGAQLAGAHLFPARYDDALAGVASGLLFGVLILWSHQRRREES